ncbi:MAG TPA: hypothetical protein VIF64_22055 [Pyrinomonadaceae bacterium]
MLTNGTNDVGRVTTATRTIAVVVPTTQVFTGTAGVPPALSAEREQPFPKRNP